MNILSKLSLVVLSLVFVTNCSSMGSKWPQGPGRIEVQGHRGARARLPENTLPAFEYALSLGDKAGSDKSGMIDVLELDTAITKDGVVVVAHDSFINPKICLAPGGAPITQKILIHALTFTELSKFDCGTKKNPDYSAQKPVPNTPIPTLAEVFNLVKNSKYASAKNVKFNIETKLDPRGPNDTLPPKEFVSLLIKQIKASGMMDRVMIQSFDFRTLKYARDFAPSIPRVMLFDDRSLDYLKDIDLYKASAISPKAILVTKTMVSNMRRFRPEVKIIPWTVNKAGGWAGWDKMVKSGVDGIISDDPESLIAYLKERGLR